MLIIHGTCISNLEPVTIASVALKIVVRGTGQVDLPGARMPEVWIWGEPVVSRVPVAIAVSRDTEANLGARKDVGRLGVGR